MNNFVGGIAKSNFGTPIPGIAVHAIRRSDGTVLGTNVTDANGKFAITGLLTQDEVYVVALDSSGRVTQVFGQVKPLSFVTLLADNQFTVNICDLVGEVGPAIVTGDITGHTIEWEQIEGPVTTLMNADTLSPVFVNNPIGQSRVFRLTIDKGTCFELTADYTISGRIETPSSPILQSAGVNYHQPQNIVIADRDFDPPVIRSVPQGWVLGSGIYISQGLCPDTLFWLQVEPPAADRFKRYELQEYISGNWITTQTANAGGLLAFKAFVGSLYRVATVYDRGLGEQYQYTKHFIFKTSGTTGSGLSINSSTVNSSYSSVTNFEVKIPTRISKVAEDTSTRLDSAYPSINNLLRIKPLVKSIQETESDSTYNSAGTTVFIVVRNNGTNIGT